MVAVDICYFARLYLKQIKQLFKKESDNTFWEKERRKDEGLFQG